MIEQEDLGKEASGQCEDAIQALEKSSDPKTKQGI